MFDQVEAFLANMDNWKKEFDASVDNMLRNLEKEEAEERKIQLERIEEEEEINFTDSMKKIFISSTKCVACGLCVEMSESIDEDEEGKAIVRGTGIINNNELDTINTIIVSCPENAIKLRNAGIVKASGKEGLNELKEIILSEFKDYKVPKPNPENYEFNKDAHYVERPSSPNEYSYDYKSYDRAMREGLREFDRIMYSKRKSIIQNLLVEYKHRALDRYIYDKKESGNYYYDICQSITKRLQTYLAQAKVLTNKSISINDDFFEINASPIFGYKGGSMDREAFVYQLRHLEEVWVTEKIMNELEPLSWFDTSIDTVDCEDYNGNDKYGYKIGEAVNDLKNQILSETSWVLNSSDGIQYILEQSFDKITEEINREINLKVSNIINIIEKLLNGEKNITIELN